MFEKVIDLELVSENFIETYDYTIRDRKYKCPCGKNFVVHSKETPNGRGVGYQSKFSDWICFCKVCDGKYDYRLKKAYKK